MEEGAHSENDHIEMNVDMAKEWPQNHQQQIMIQAMRRQQTIDQNREKREIAAEQERRMKIFMNMKWGILKERRLEYEQVIALRQAHRRKMTKWLNHMDGLQVLKTVYQVFMEKKAHHQKIAQMSENATKVSRVFFRWLRRFHSKESERQIRFEDTPASILIRNFRQSLVVLAQPLEAKHVESAE